METMRAIETIHNGHRFRSRLEARWAVWMEHLGIEYWYEHQGFVVDGTPYLPDFWLPRHDLWLEIKPVAPSASELRLLQGVSRQTRRRGVLLAGNCWWGQYQAYLTYGFDIEAPDTPQQELVLCRRCNGLCLAGITGQPGQREIEHFEEVGHHNCGDHEKWPQVAEDHPRVAAAFRQARMARFQTGGN